MRTPGMLTCTVLLIVGQVASLRGQAIETHNFCAVCHSEHAVAFRESIHAQEQMTCVDCHGGNPRARAIPQAHGNGFRTFAHRKDIAELCAGCHADPIKMKPYGIPIDQYALYLTSAHGQRLLQGDNRVAVCSDCHDAHRVLPVRDARSPVHFENIPNTCGRCHADETLMRMYGLPATVVDDYRDSVHGRALLERHNHRAPDCARCHGTHGAAPPGAGNAEKVCGQCHTRTMAFFREGPHGHTPAKRTHVACVDCHGYHRIEPPTHDLLTTSCGQCHTGDSPALRRGRRIRQLLIEAEAAIARAQQAIAAARAIPLDVRDYASWWTDAWTHLVEARIVTHTLSLDMVADHTRSARSIAREIQSEIYRKIRIFRSRYIILIIIWFYILITITVVHHYRQACCRATTTDSA